MTESIAYKLHIGICFFSEAHSKEDVDGEARVSNPAIPVVPISSKA
jgi:hypothetical protein